AGAGVPGPARRPAGPAVRQRPGGAAPEGPPARHPDRRGAEGLPAPALAPGAARLHVVSHGLPDIVAALPEAAVGAALRAAGGGTFPGWARLAEGARRRKISLKDHFAQRLGVTVDGAFVDSVLRAADPAAPAPELDRAMQ